MIEAAVLNHVLDREWTLKRRGPLSWQKIYPCEKWFQFNWRKFNLTCDLHVENLGESSNIKILSVVFACVLAYPAIPHVKLTCICGLEKKLSHCKKFIWLTRGIFGGNSQCNISVQDGTLWGSLGRKTINIKKFGGTPPLLDRNHPVDVSRSSRICCPIYVDLHISHVGTCQMSCCLAPKPSLGHFHGRPTTNSFMRSQVLCLSVFLLPSQKSPHAHKIRIGTSTPPPFPNPSPKMRDFMGMGGETARDRKSNRIAQKRSSNGV